MSDTQSLNELKTKKLLSGTIRRKIHFFQNLSNENSENKVLFALSSSLICYNFSSGFVVSKFNLSSKIKTFYIEDDVPNIVIISKARHMF